MVQGGIMEIINNTKTMKKQILILIVLVGGLLTGCEKKEDAPDELKVLMVRSTKIIMNATKYNKDEFIIQSSKYINVQVNDSNYFSSLDEAGEYKYSYIHHTNVAMAVDEYSLKITNGGDQIKYDFKRK
jgi:hypothetical protein